MCRPGNIHILPPKDAVLTVKRQMIGKLADDQMGKQSHIRFAFGNGMLRHGGGDHAGKGVGAFRQGILGAFVNVDNQFSGAIFQLL